MNAMKDALGHGTNPRAFDDEVTNALARCHTAHRTLAIARQAQQRHHMAIDGVRLIDDCVDALVNEVVAAEAALVKLLDEAGGTVNAQNWSLTASVSDRRRKMRPAFMLHKHTEAQARRRAPAPVSVPVPVS